jgi:hypothetical protein
MERAQVHVSEMNEQMARQLKEKEACIKELERGFFELKRENQTLHKDLLTQRMATPNFGD